jgi:hypothetical protein
MAKSNGVISGAAIALAILSGCASFIGQGLVPGR